MKRQEDHRHREPQEKTQKEREYRFPQPKIKVSLVWNYSQVGHRQTGPCLR